MLDARIRTSRKIKVRIAIKTKLQPQITGRIEERIRTGEGRIPPDVKENDDTDQQGELGKGSGAVGGEALPMSRKAMTRMNRSRITGINGERILADGGRSPPDVKESDDTHECEKYIREKRGKGGGEALPM